MANLNSDLLDPNTRLILDRAGEIMRTWGKPIGPVWMHMGSPSSASISQALNDFGLSSSLGSKSLVEPPVKMRRPARPLSAQPLITAGTSSASMSTEPTATSRSLY